MSNNDNFQLDPHWITGLVDGEGCFRVTITPRKDIKLGWQVCPSFQICIHVEDKGLIEEIKNYLGVGHVIRQGPKAVQLRVQSFAELEKILMHFNKYPLKTKKQADFKLFIMVIEKIQRKEHLTLSGLQAIVAIRASMNWGLSQKLKLAFPDIVPVLRPL